MKNLSINLLKLCLVWAITVFLVASCSKPTYANGVHPHGELALVGYQSLAHIPRLNAVFFVRTLYAFAFYGEAGGGRVRACW